MFGYMWDNLHSLAGVTETSPSVAGHLYNLADLKIVSSIALGTLVCQYSYVRYDIVFRMSCKHAPHILVRHCCYIVCS